MAAVDRSFYRDVELACLTLLMIAATVPRLTVLPVWGEESRWAVVAREMMESGNYIVPTQQGVAFPDRPPMLSWTMIVFSRVLGDFTLTSVRLPSVVATIVTVWLIYIYARQFLTAHGALAAALAYPTMGVMLKFQRVAETDAMLALWVTGSLFVWHIGYRSRWPAALTWTAGYACAALAALTKGPQGPIYFLSAAAALLAYERNGKYFFSRAHLVGIAGFAAIVGLWLVPFTRLAGWHAALASVTQIAARGRFVYSPSQLGHIVGYPIEVFVSTLPWSVMLIAFLDPSIRERVASSGRAHVVFLTSACGVGFLSCWVAASSGTRHLIAIYPCMSVLIGAAIEATWNARRRAPWDRRIRLLIWTAVVIAVGSAVIVDVAAMPTRWRQPWFAPPAALAVAHTMLAAVAVLVLRSALTSTTPEAGKAAVFGIAALIAFAYVGPIVEGYAAIGPETAVQAAAVHAKLPAGASLVGLGPIDHRFLYFYGQPIARHPWPRTATDLDPHVRYFCFVPYDKAAVPLPFAWDLIATVSCDWRRRADPRRTVIVGRRIDDGPASRPAGQ